MSSPKSAHNRARISPLRRARKVLHNAVRYQLSEFKQAEITRRGVLLSLPEGRALSAAEASVDHARPGFAEVMRSFFQAHEIHLTNIQPSKIRKLIPAWQAFHQANAVPGMRIVSRQFNEFRTTPQYQSLFQAGHAQGAMGLPLTSYTYEIPAHASAHTEGWRCGAAFHTGRKEGAAGLAFMPSRFDDPLVQASYKDGHEKGTGERKVLKIGGGV